MPLQITLSHRARRDLQRISQIDPTLIRRLCEKLDRVTEKLSISTLKRIISEQFESDDSDILMRFILFVADCYRRENLSIADFREDISEAIKEDADFTGLDAKHRTETIDALHALLQRDIVHFLAKASELAVARENIISSLVIYNDIRPVFDDSRDNIIGMISGCTLHVEYANGWDRRIVEFALDYEALVKLAADASRAIKKTEKVEELLSKQKIENLTIGRNFNVPDR